MNIITSNSFKSVHKQRTESVVNFFIMDVRREMLREMNLTDDEDFLELIELEVFSRRPRQLRQKPDHFNIWNEEEFRARFRLSKNTVSLVVDEIRNNISFIKNE